MIAEFKFPKFSQAQIAFSTLKADPVLLAEAKRLGFYNGDTPYNRLFSQLFYKGGMLIFKKDVSQGFYDDAMSYLKALMNSFEPKHEEKEAICALILSELVDAKESLK